MSDTGGNLSAGRTTVSNASTAADVEAAVAADLLARGEKKRSTSEIGDALAKAVS